MVGDTTYDDGSRRLVEDKKASVPFDLDYLESTSRAPSAKRNLGIKRARGELVGFTDDDCIAKSDWIKQIVPNFSDFSVAGVQGKTVIPSMDRSKNGYCRALHLTKTGYQTCNIFYRKKILEEVGGFDERFVESAREDSDLAFTALKRGYRIGYAPTAIIKHPVNDDESWDLIKSAKRALSDPLLYKKHPDLYRQNIGTVFSGSYKLIYGLALGTLIMTAAGNYMAATLFLLSYLAVLVLSALRQLKGKRTRGQLGKLLASLFIAPYILLYSVFAGNLKYRSRLWY